MATEDNSQDNADESHEAKLEADGEGIELVFGFVGPTGIDLGVVTESLKRQLKAVKYETETIRLSELITPYLFQSESVTKFLNEYQRIKTLMDNGTRLREATQQKDIVARLGVARIRSIREQRTKDKLKPIPRVAYVVSSFKRPEEIHLFRQIYGKAFTLISVYSPRQARVHDLARRLRSSVPKEGHGAEELAVQLVQRDFEEEDRKLGQRMGRTFPLADYFVTAEPRAEMDKQLHRLVQLTFGNPYLSPTADEQAMFFAQAAALRSLDLSRQVGAVTVDDDGAVLSTGCNEVPKFGGGLYWENSLGKRRDYELGFDSNAKIKTEMLEDVFARLRRNDEESTTSDHGAPDDPPKKWLSDEAKAQSDERLANAALYGSRPFLSDSALFDVIEYGRAVHAEAAAITEAARRGVSLSGSRLFCTTFPCHICARHIVASGIKEVLFIEPYEKSRTAELYSDSVSVEPTEPSDKRVNFRAFVGVAPRRFMDFFQMMPGSRKGATGAVLDMDDIAGQPRTQRIVLTYLLIEGIVIRETKKPASQVGDGS